jgi:tRNA 2-selenouridine synthase
MQTIRIENLWLCAEDASILDVRTPAEFQKGHIPNAKNLPLFSNEERVVVGTIYKQDSPENALLQGLDFVGSKMSFFIREAKKIAPNKKVIMHCWRGGKRSQSMAWLLAMAGFDVTVLHGGYKAYRQYVQHFLATQKPKFVLLGGQTGSGKTEVLQHLQAMGEQVLDLEKLANHKGSAFGSLGESPQPSCEHFENLLFTNCRLFDFSRRIFVENESKIIGTCLIPPYFYASMRNYFFIHYSIPIDLRVQRLVADYAVFSKEELKDRFAKIKNKLGGEQYKNSLQNLDENNFASAAEIALKFYDKTYLFGLENNTTPNKIELKFEHANMEIIAKEIQTICSKQHI